MKNKLIGLEALRGFVALYVVLHHSHIAPNSGLGVIFYFGQEAVILFFLLSGFVISFSMRDRFDVGRYLIARAKRIFPIFVFALGISYLSVALVAQSLPDPDLSSLLGNLLMLQDVSALKRGVWFDTYMGNSPLWSLSYEWWFYILFIPVGLAKPEGRGLVLAFCISVLGWALYAVRPNQVALFLQYFLIWWAGVEFAKQYKVDGLLSFKRQQLLFAFLLVLVLLQAVSVFIYWKAGVAGLKLVVDPVLQLRHFLAATALLALTITWGKFKYKGFMKAFGLFRHIAPISYAIYVIHQPILNFFAGVGWSFSKLEVLIVSLPFILFFSWLLEGKMQGFVNRITMSSSARGVV